MINDIQAQAHFVAYAAPAFIAFRRQVHLELSMATTWGGSAEASRYKLAALAFDEQISPLFRRVITYFPGDRKFDRVSFSTTLRNSARPGVKSTKALSVEFLFRLESLRRYVSSECTGQQLIDGGVVLINGECAGLDLESQRATVAGDRELVVPRPPDSLAS